MTGIQRLLKRWMDLTIAVPALLLLLPLLLGIAMLVRVRLGAPVLFCQERPGVGGRAFRMLKFRTMTDARDAAGKLLPDEQRLTPFGRFLRETSLDELPELWNVLRGEMSLVGPRPLLMEYLDLYTPEQARRHDVAPGITGWAQVNGRNAISWEEKFALDRWYVDHQNVWLDLKILLATAKQVLSRNGISSGNHATMPRFRGETVEPESREVVVIGAGGHAKVVIDTLKTAGYRLRGIYDDNPALHGASFQGERILGGTAVLAQQPGTLAIIAIGCCRTRAAIAERLPCRWLTLVHPRATIASDVQLGEGSFVAAGAVIQAAARIGCHVIVNTSASVDHDCQIDDFVHLGPGARLAGDVHVESSVFCGTGSVVLPGVRLGARSLLGAGAVATRSIDGDCVAVGVPARRQRCLPAGTQRVA